MPQLDTFLYHQIFAADPSGGNSCWVVLDADPLTDRDMKEISATLAISATAFLRNTDNNSAQIRFFSPAGEFDMCGHAVAAAVCSLAEKGIIPSTVENQKFLLHTSTGEVAVETHYIEPMLRHCAMTQQQPWFKPTTIETKDVASLLGIEPDAIDSELPFNIGSTGLKHVFIPLLNRNAMMSMQPDFDGLKLLSNRLGVESIAIFTQDTGDQGITVRVRDLCPAIGVNEEAASGTTNGAIASYLVHHNRILPDETGKVLIVAEQGIEFGRPSVIQTEISVNKDSIVSVKVGGPARQLVSGTINA